MIKEIRNNQDPSMVRIEYMLGNLCNHKCYYCFPGSNEGDMPWPNFELAKQNLGHLLKHFESQGKTKSDIFFVGGEPTLWKGLEELCLYLKENFDVIIEISTNGTRKVNWWKEHAKNFDHVGVSVHREFVNLAHIRDVCDILYEEGVFVNADVLIDPNDFEGSVANVEWLTQHSKYSWPIIAKVVNFEGSHRYTEEQLIYFNESIKRYPNQEWYDSTTKKLSRQVEITRNDGSTFTVDSDSWLTKNKLNYFKGWECNLGVDFLKIFSNGSITGNCGQTLYGDHNLYDADFSKSFNPTIAPVICTKSICPCNEEMVCNKRKLNV
jgi:organic radical activating enzyme